MNPGLHQISKPELPSRFMECPNEECEGGDVERPSVQRVGTDNIPCPVCHGKALHGLICRLCLELPDGCGCEDWEARAHQAEETNDYTLSVLRQTPGEIMESHIGAGLLALRERIERELET